MEVAGWLGGIHEIEGLGPQWAGLLCMAASALCGCAIGLERERRDKPAGLRTVILICLGSTIYTLVSLLLASKNPNADPARLAAQILPGIGFLGAGAIIRSRGNVVGLTTGATIWAVAAIGVTIGAGYVVAAFVFTLVILVVLTTAHRLNVLATGRCDPRPVAVVYRPESGKTQPRVQGLLDAHLVPDERARHSHREDGLAVLETTVCMRHREHRALLAQLAEVPEIIELTVKR